MVKQPVSVPGPAPPLRVRNLRSHQLNVRMYNLLGLVRPAVRTHPLS